MDGDHTATLGENPYWKGIHEWSSFWSILVLILSKVIFFYQCSKMQFITFQNFHIRTCFSQFLWFFSLKCWFKGQMMSKIHLSLPNAYKLMCFDRNVNGNRDVKFLECDKWSLHWYKNLTLVISIFFSNSQPSASNFKSFSWSLEQFFLTESQTNFGNFG